MAGRDDYALSGSSYRRAGRSLSWKRVSDSFAILAACLGIAAGTTSVFESIWSQESPIEDRVQVLSGALNDATRLISEIQKEIDDRVALVSELEKKAEIAEQLSASSKEQVEAVALLLRTELDRNETWTFWISTIQRRCTRSRRQRSCERG